MSSIRDTAEQIVREHVIEYRDSWEINFAELTAAIESALLAERERCAKIADTHCSDYDPTTGAVEEIRNCVAQRIAAAIREED